MNSKGMKRLVLIIDAIVIAMIAISLFNGTFINQISGLKTKGSFANNSNYSFNFIPNPTEKRVKAGETVTIKLSAEDIYVGENGINSIVGYLGYDENLFDSVEFIGGDKITPADTSKIDAGQESTDWFLELNKKKGHAMYGKFCIYTMQEGVKEDKVVATMVVKLKKDLKPQTTKINFTKLASSDGEVEVPEEDRSVTLIIYEDGIEPEVPSEPEKTETKTGDNIAAMIILIVLATAVITLNVFIFAKNKRLMSIIMVMFVGLSCVAIKSQALPEGTTISDAISNLKYSQTWLNSEDYLVTKDNISRVAPETTVSTYVTKFNKEKGVNVYEKSSDSLVDNNALIGTGMRTSVKNADKYDADGNTKYTISVWGDTNGDGKSNQVELTTIIRNVLDSEKWDLDDAKLYAADMSVSGEIDPEDIKDSVKYIVYGESEIPNFAAVTAPTITISSGDYDEESSSYSSNVTITITENEANAKNTQYKVEDSEGLLSDFTEIARTEHNEEGKVITTITLRNNEIYKISAYTTGKLGNRSEIPYTIIDLNKVDPNLELGTPTIVHTPTTWTNQDVTVTITKESTEPRGTAIKYRVKGSETWLDYSEPFTIGENCTIEAELTLLLKTGSTVEHAITNIDKEKPTFGTITKNTDDANEVKLNFTATDNLSGLVQYGYKRATASTYTTTACNVDTNGTGELEKSIQIGGITSNGKYNLMLKDAAGNVQTTDITINSFVTTDVAEIVAVPSDDQSLASMESNIDGEPVLNHTYTTLEAAIYEAELINQARDEKGLTGKVEIKILKDITGEANQVKTGNNVIIDLNSCTASASDDENGILKVESGASLDLIDRSEDQAGSILNSSGVGINLQNGGELTIGEDDGIYAVSTTCPVVQGGTYGICMDNNPDQWVFNYYDGVIIGDTNARNDLKVDDWPVLYKVHQEEKNIDNKTKQEATLQVDSEVEAIIGKRRYYQLQKAFDDINNGVLGTETVEIKLIKDASLDNLDCTDDSIPNGIVLDENKSAILDLNGHFVSGDINEAIIDNHGNLQIVDNTAVDDEQSIGEIHKYDENDEYFFEKKGRFIVPNNSEIKNTSAKGYIKVDLTNKLSTDTFKISIYCVAVNGDNCISVTESEEMPTDYDESISRTVTVRSIREHEYEVSGLEGGKIYYIHLKSENSGYIVSPGLDAFSINEIRLTNEITNEINNVIAGLNCTRGRIFVTEAAQAIKNSKDATLSISNAYVLTPADSNSNADLGDLLFNLGTLNISECKMDGIITSYPEETNSSSINDTLIFRKIINGEGYVDGHPTTRENAQIDMENVTLYSTLTNGGIINAEGCKSYINAILHDPSIQNDGTFTMTNFVVGDTFINNGTATMTKSKCYAVNNNATMSILESDVSGSVGTGGTLTLKESNAGSCSVSSGTCTIEQTNVVGTIMVSAADALNIRGGNIGSIADNTDEQGVYYTLHDKLINVEDGTITNGMNIDKGTINIGKKDNKNAESPRIEGGVKCAEGVILNFYDGIIIGQANKALIGVINEIEEFDENGNTFCLVDNNDTENNTEEISLGTTNTNAVRISASANINETNYASLEGDYYYFGTFEAALAACKENVNTEIEFVQDTVITTINIPENYDIKIDINGCDVKLYNTIYNNGKLEIVDDNETKGQFVINTNRINNNASGTLTIKCNLENYNVTNAGTINITGENAKVYKINNTGYVNVNGGYVREIASTSGVDDSITISAGTVNTINANHNLSVAQTVDNKITLGHIDIGDGELTLNGFNNDVSVICGKATIENCTLRFGSVGENSEIINSTIKSQINLNFILGDGTSIHGKNGGKCTISGIIEVQSGDVTIADSEFNNGTVINSGTGTVTITDVSCSTNGNANIRNTNEGAIVIDGAALSSCSIINSGTGTIQITSNAGNEITSTTSSNLITNNGGGTIQIGENDGSIKNYPVLTGYRTCINNTNGNIKFYDGRLRAYSTTESEIVVVSNSGQFSRPDGIELDEQSTTEENSGVTKYIHEVTLMRLDVAQILASSINADNLTAGTYIKEGDYYKFSVLQNAINACSDNTDTTITLLRDIEFTSENALVVGEDKVIKLDLNGHYLNLSSPLNNNGTLTIKDSGETGGLLKLSAANVLNNNGTCTFDNIAVNEATSGTDASHYITLIQNTGTLNFNGNYSNENTDARKYTLEGNFITFVNNAEGGIVKTNKVNIVDTVALTTSMDKAFITNSGDVEIKDSRIESLNITNNNPGTIEINGSETSGAFVNNSAKMYEEGTSKPAVKICNSNIKARATLSTDTRYNIHNKAGEMIIDGENTIIEKATQTDNVLIDIVNAENAKLTLKNGNLRAVNIKNSGTFNMTNGTICGSVNNTGTATITGGTVTDENISSYNVTTAQQYDFINTGTMTIGTKDGNVNENSPEIKYVSTSYPYYFKAGGTFNYYDGKLQAHLVGLKNGITGYITDIEDGATITYTKQNDCITYTMRDKTIATIGENNYKSLSAAIAACADNTKTTIKLQDDIIITSDDRIDIEANKNIVLDLNGHGIRENAMDYLFSVKGIFEITDSGENGYVDCTTTYTQCIKNMGQTTISGGSFYGYGDSSTQQGEYIIYSTVTNDAHADYKVYITGGKLYGPKIYTNRAANTPDYTYTELNISGNAYIKGRGNYASSYGIVLEYGAALEVNGANTEIMARVENKVKSANIKEAKYVENIVNSGKLTIEYCAVGSIDNQANSSVGSTVTLKSNSVVNNIISNYSNLYAQDSIVAGYISNHGTVYLVKNVVVNECADPIEISTSEGTFTFGNSQKDYGIDGGYVVMGEKDYNVKKEDIKVYGKKSGIKSANITMYDGTIYGDTIALGSGADVTATEDLYEVKRVNEGKELYLVLSATVEDAAQIGANTFETLNQAIKAAEDAGVTTCTIELINKDTIFDNADNKIVIHSGMNITINLGSYSIMGLLTNAPAILIENGAQLTLIGGATPGVVNKLGVAIENNGTLVIGDNSDSNENNSRPIIEGHTNAITNNGTIEMYDGTIRSLNDVINGTAIATYLSGYTPTNTTEIVDGVEYNVVKLVN